MYLSHFFSHSSRDDEDDDEDEDKDGGGGGRPEMSNGTLETFFIVTYAFETTKSQTLTLLFSRRVCSREKDY